jgi:DNA-binding NarL/FixJ family response regulator
MRTKTTLTQLQKEVTALDMAVRHLRQQVTTQTQTIITLKKALNAPLSATEQEIFDAQPVEIQTTINQSANLIASATRTRTTNQPTVVNYTVTTPASRTRTKSAQPLSQTRWTTKEEQIMRRMLKEGKTMKQVSQALQRSIKACDLHWRIMNKKKGK